MQTLAEKQLNPHNWHLSGEAKKRLLWMYLLYHDQKGNVSGAARKAGISRPWMSHLKQVFEKNRKDPRSLEPESKVPHHVQSRKRIPEETERLIIKIRDDSWNVWGKEKISRVLKRDYGLGASPNTVNNYLHKHKRISPKISLKNTKAMENKKARDSDNLMLKVKFRPPKILKDYAPGALVEKDMKYVPKPGQKYAMGKHQENFWYQHTEIDSFTRIRAVEVSDGQDTKTTIDCHKKAARRFPFKIACENTDNGFENNNDFSKALKKENVFHFYSNNATPTDNPRVERSHLTDDLEFYHRLGVSNDLLVQQKRTQDFEDRYNFKRPHQALAYLTPMEFYRLWLKSPVQAYAITAKWQEYLKKQRIRLACSRRIKKKEQVDALMRFIDAKLQNKKEEVEEAKLQLINCQLCSGTFYSESQLPHHVHLPSATMNSMAKQITDDQRNEICALRRAGHKQKDIAHLLHKDPSTISRELKRNKSDSGRYLVRGARRKTKERRIKANARFKKVEYNVNLRKYLVKKLKKYSSPEQIAGQWNRTHKNQHIGKDTIYKFVYEKRKDLVKYLRCQKGKYRRRYGTKIREKQREEQKKRRIDQRPEIINARARIGDWEGDTVRGQGSSGHIITYVERKSGYLVAGKVQNATAENINTFTIKEFNKMQKDKRLSITYDNGSEFWGYDIIEEQTGIIAYFAWPYHSWERGTNENTNGLLRQFFPKKMRFDTVTQEQLDKVVRLINNRPRKRLNYLTPYEIFKKNCVLE